MIFSLQDILFNQDTFFIRENRDHKIIVHVRHDQYFTLRFANLSPWPK